MSKELYELTLPHLYRRVDWSVPSTGISYTLMQMLEKENRGLSYVRELVLWDEENSTRRPTKHGDYADAALLAYLLPQNILTRFE